MQPTHRDAAAWCHRTCLALPGATQDNPFGPQTDVFRVHGKVFALLMHVPHVSEHLIVNLKAEPDEVPLLVAEHEAVLPGYHMNKKHWVSVVLAPDVDHGLVEELVEDSYDNVVSGLPARLRSTLQALGPGSSARTVTDG
ncbi:MmcQ/YjbR family DNA-binding protein [Cellulomonas soli]